MDKAIIIIILTVVILGFLFWGFQTGFFVKKEPASPLPEGILLFYGDGCPFCKKVEDFISENKIAEKVPFKNLEISFEGKTSKELQTNSGFLVQAAQNCKLDIKGGVNIPFLYDGQNCLIGEPDIVNFFKLKANIQ